MDKNLVILGAGDFGAVASVYLRDAGLKVECHVIDDARYKSVESLDGIGVMVCPLEEMARHFPPRLCDCVVAIGYSKLNQNRLKKLTQLMAYGYDLKPFVHPSIRNYGKVGRGSFVLEGNVIQPFVEIGEGCVLWCGNHVGHHSRIENGVFLTSHVVVSSRCVFGERSFIGVNATLNDKVTLGRACVIQSGALVDLNLPDESVFSREGLSKVPSSRIRL